MSQFCMVLLCAVMITASVEEEYRLSCLGCHSKDVNSRCRYGQRSKTTKREICRGPTAKCFVLATVNEYGSPYFRRGCTLEDICAERNDSDIEFCFTCASKHCNYNVIELDQEVEEYLNEVREEEISNDDLLKPTLESVLPELGLYRNQTDTPEQSTVSPPNDLTYNNVENNGKIAEENVQMNSSNGTLISDNYQRNEVSDIPVQEEDSLEKREERVQLEFGTRLPKKSQL